MNSEIPNTDLNPAAVQALLRYLAIFADDAFAPGEWRGGDRNKAGVIQMPWFSYNNEVGAFIRTMYADGWVIAFDWGAWQQEAGAIVASGRLETASLDTLRRLLTLLVRKERFYEGTLASAFTSGLIVRILRRLETIATLESNPAP